VDRRRDTVAPTPGCQPRASHLPKSLSNAEIGRELYISDITVKTHI
jgi:DNA-binding CsgD family transcriptional regulator